ncbi:lipid A export permease/ATP-binding protein MsbA [Metallibacterium scheffleri]|uniref:Lipid A export permease/ATP-binding protein MsbA n=1 Tax=Metallibacterium scheffleri TaxID=993689 RepID=A0A4S3KGU9_9GAMM|nr:lipid A export permease/ATP-binding protein MsbA [Metallibacterium scheffleri]THD07885.1 lipid A export permease/ATP-binding protein MsbA [Metallibacterium scheffleri]
MDAHAAREASAWPTYRRLLGYLRPYRPVAVAVVIGMAVDAAALGAFAGLVRPLIDKVFITRDAEAIFWLPLIIIAIFLLRAVATFITSYGMAYIGRGVVQTMREQVFGRYLDLPGGFFGREASGHQVARITYTADQLAQATTEAVRVSIIDSLTILAMIGVMLWNSWRLTLVLLVMVPTIAVVVYLVSRRYRAISRGLQNSMGDITGVVDEIVSAWREVRIYAGQKYEAARFHAVADHNRALNVKISATNAISTALVQFFAASALAGIVFFATRPGIAEHMTAGRFMSMIMAMAAILPPLKRMTNVQSMLQRGITAAQDVFVVLDEPREPDAHARPLQELRQGIEFREVTMRYAPGTPPALRAASFRCAAGKVTAVVGRSGSGKTTVAHLIPRFYEPESGSILVDGHALGEYQLASLRGQISWVGQDVVIFNGSVAENIAYGEMAGAREADIIAAARAANAWDFIAQMPRGLHSPIGQRGFMVSGGQRQRIAIARAILKNAPILILDEATSALDTESERLIHEALQRLMQDRTTLVIAHRLSTVEHAHRIIVLDQGCVLEQGSHDELLARPDGAYAHLHRMQFSAPRGD